MYWEQVKHTQQIERIREVIADLSVNYQIAVVRFRVSASVHAFTTVAIDFGCGPVLQVRMVEDGTSPHLNVTNGHWTDKLVREQNTS